MSITIDWPGLTTGPSGLALADSIRAFIHDKFQQVTLPRFIRSVHVHSFDFGPECPLVELKDISDPLPDFYEDDDDDDEDSVEDGEGEEEEEEEEAVTGAIEETTSSTAPKQSIQAPYRQNGASATAIPSAIDTRLPKPTLRSGLAFPPPEQISTPFLSRSTTPGIPIPGGTSNFSYFHLPLSAGLSGTQTPLPWGEHHHHHQRPPSPLLRREQQGHVPWSAHADPTSRPTTRDSNTRSQSPESRSTASEKPHGGIPTTAEDRSQDVQTTLHISYRGSLSLSLTAEILLDYPMPSFVGIPLKLQITGLTFDGVALLAYLRHTADAERRKVHFCFLGREDAKAMVGQERGDGDEGKGGGEEEEEDEEGLGGLLREIRVESEIGRQEDGKQVLKNVGKVEKFVLEQVRRIFEDEFVWPSFWTFLL
ncbi:MAG: Mitochondrial distribution and morphology protein 12 [Alectoria sarmentosa]|nr:MAG: Mitochondrial distribution and morphology protein 12 [Alectoria sarmentosa]